MNNQTQRKLQIFISSTFTDLRNERQVAVTAILENLHIPAGMELFAAGNEEQMQVIRRWIDESDIFLLILGRRYGSIEHRSNLSYTQLEYEYAIESKKPFFTIVLSDDYITSKLKEGERIEDLSEQENPAKFKKFYELVTKRMCKFVDDDKDIRIAIGQSIRNIERQNDLTGWISGRYLPIKIGRIAEYYFPFEIPPMQTQCGMPENDSDAKLGRSLFAKWVDPTKKYAVFGPYLPLPVMGHYIAKFNIKLICLPSVTKPQDEIVRLDVFDYYGGKTKLGELSLHQSDLETYYTKFNIEFDYLNMNQLLEYRISIRKPGVSIACDHIRIDRVHDLKNT